MTAFKKLEKIRVINELSTLINAGVSPSDALKKLRETDVRVSVFLGKTASCLRKGKPFSESLSESGLFNRFDLIVLGIAENSGQLCAGLSDIHKRLEKRHNQIMALKQKCYLPLATLSIAILATSLIALVRDTPLMAFFQLINGLGYFLIVVVFIRFFLNRSDKASEDSFKVFWRHAPLRSVSVLRNTVEYHFYYTLIMQLNSRVDALQSIKILTKLCNEPDYIKAVDQCHNAISSGNDLSSALSSSGLVFSSNLYQLFYSAEKSGSLASGLTKYLLTQEIELEDEIRLLNQWLARILYFVVLLLALSLF